MSQDLEAKFPFYMDGQEAAMLASALLEQASRCNHPLRASMNRDLARRITEGKKDFQAAAGAVLVGRYNIQS